MGECKTSDIQSERINRGTALSRSYSLLWRLHRRGTIHSVGSLPYIEDGHLASLAGVFDIDFYPRKSITRNDVSGYGILDVYPGRSMISLREKLKGFSNKIRLVVTPSSEEKRINSLIVDIHANFRYRQLWLQHLPTGLLERCLTPSVEIAFLTSYLDGYRFGLIRANTTSNGTILQESERLDTSCVTKFYESIYEITKTL